MFVLVIISCMLFGVALGYFTRSHKFDKLSSLISILIGLLLFLLGVEVGNNEAILKGLHTLGLEALFITMMALAGSVFFAALLWQFVKHRIHNKKEKDA